MKTSSDNKLIATRFLELVSEGKVEEIFEVISPSWKMNIGLGKAEIPIGHDGMKKLFESFGEIEQEWIIDDVIAEGNKVVVRATNNCMQQSFLGVPSHGKRQTFTATFIHHIVDGRIQETWRNADDLGRIFQLGAEIKPQKTIKGDKGYERKICWWKYIFQAFWWKRSY
ncbi:MAG TPA: ester cyclase [Chitinophagaceae bacterium]|nr:ester cyclase [Chitinophagaceae bacterium]